MKSEVPFEQKHRDLVTETVTYPGQYHAIQNNGIRTSERQNRVFLDDKNLFVRTTDLCNIELTHCGRMILTIIQG